MAKQFFSTTEFAGEVGVSRITVWTMCRRHPGFAMRFGRDYKIPARHLDLVRAGMTPADIAREIRASVDRAAA